MSFRVFNEVLNKNFMPMIKYRKLDSFYQSLIFNLEYDEIFSFNNSYYFIGNTNYSGKDMIIEMKSNDGNSNNLFINYSSNYSYYDYYNGVSTKYFKITCNRNHIKFYTSEQQCAYYDSNSSFSQLITSTYFANFNVK